MIGPSGRTRDVHAFATIKLSQRVKKKKKKKKNAESSKWLQVLASCGIERQLENEGIEKASVEGDVSQVATDL